MTHVVGAPIVQHAHGTNHRYQLVGICPYLNRQGHDTSTDLDILHTLDR
jgi:hypothetical protein